MSRPSWDEYFMQMAQVAKERTTCLRRKVGAVIVRDKQIVSTGYNGAPSGAQHCEVVGCERERLGIPPGERHEICRGLHAEQNALIQAAVHGVSVAGGELYVTDHPCVICAKMVMNAHIKCIVYAGDYQDRLSYEMLKEARFVPVARGDDLKEYVKQL